MSGHPQGGHYDDGYGQTQPAGQPHAQDAYYHDDQQYGQYHDDAQAPAHGQYAQQGDAYYDENQCVFATCTYARTRPLTSTQSLLRQQRPAAAERLLRRARTAGVPRRVL
jgi:hypothetical protein